MCGGSSLLNSHKMLVGLYAKAMIHRPFVNNEQAARAVWQRMLIEAQ